MINKIVISYHERSFSFFLDTKFKIQVFTGQQCTGKTLTTKSLEYLQKRAHRKEAFSSPFDSLTLTEENGNCLTANRNNWSEEGENIIRQIKNGLFCTGEFLKNIKNYFDGRIDEVFCRMPNRSDFDESIKEYLRWETIEIDDSQRIWFTRGPDTQRELLMSEGEERIFALCLILHMEFPESSLIVLDCPERGLQDWVAKDLLAKIYDKFVYDRNGSSTQILLFTQSNEILNLFNDGRVQVLTEVGNNIYSARLEFDPTCLYKQVKKFYTNHDVPATPTN